MNVILLNGPSSAGKSTIAAGLRGLLPAFCGRDCAVVSLDDFLAMSPDEPIWEDDVFETVEPMNASIAAAIESGCDVIIDHAITSERIFRGITEPLAGHSVFPVLVTCAPDILAEREKARGDRFPGSAETSAQYLYPQSGYRLTLDTGTLSPDEAALTIATVVGGAEFLSNKGGF